MSSTLAKITKDIEKFKTYGNPTDMEAAFCQEMNQTIAMIDAAMSGWMKGGSINTHYQLNILNRLPTQAEVNEEALTTEYRIGKFTQSMISTLYTKVSDEIQNENTRPLFHRYLASMENTLFQLLKQLSRHPKITDLHTLHHYTTMLGGPIFSMGN